MAAKRTMLWLLVAGAASAFSAGQRGVCRADGGGDHRDGAFCRLVRH